MTVSYPKQFSAEQKIGLRVTFKDEDAVKIIRSLTANKAHSHDDILIRLLKTCHAEVIRPISLLCVRYFKSNTVPVHKKEGMQCMTHCPSNKMKKSGDLLITLQNKNNKKEKRKEKKKKQQTVVYLHLNKTLVSLLTSTQVCYCDILIKIW